MKEKLKKFIEKDGFYLILFICVCIVAITAVWASKVNLDKSDEDNLSQNEEDFIIVDDELETENSVETSTEDEKIDEKESDEEETGKEKTEEKPKEEETEEKTSEETEEEKVNDEKADEEILDEELDEDPTTEEIATASNQSNRMGAPVMGKISTEYTDDNLIYSETLEEWTSHKGVDIVVEEGARVLAALSGTISEVYNDPLWGMITIIDHGNGLLTKYANLSTEELLSEGVAVNEGDPIGKVGKTATVEMMMDPHLHFEVIKDGTNVDPEDHLPSFIYSE
ncbi:M23 family metallopeptidase [Schnuerera sp. xch1]|uniref:M23 family metallopeptidase n=1 Tax=Schnuerera sp. xch1 TaxID=2874283 RepID=UPI001CC0F9D4|nr:M23 family metallopeptidase [Schnuerera sp. xch1]MBZ2174802.1 M23 family metallopeptidase [Schnuerera sp. xch1]